MDKRRLGDSELEVFPIGLGAMGMSGLYGETDEKESIATIHEALDRGVNLIDTADVYGEGHNEQLLEKALGKRRNGIVLATKFGLLREGGAYVGINGKPEYVKQSCEDSLRRLGTDVIDLYYLHRVDPQVPIEDTVGAMSELVKEGKVRCLGLSEVSAEILKRAHSVHPIAAVQSEYSLWSLDVQETVLPACRELGVSLVPFSPLGRGFLTGQVRKLEDLAEDDFRRALPRFQGANFQKNLDLVDRLKEIATERGIKPSQLALAWLLEQGKDIIPIPGTKRKKYLIENIESLKVQFTQEELDSIGSLLKEVVGGRYPENIIPTNQ